jgi:hypothetical protein
VLKPPQPGKALIGDFFNLSKIFQKKSSSTEMRSSTVMKYFSSSPAGSGGKCLNVHRNEIFDRSESILQIPKRSESFLLFPSMGERSGDT